MIPELKNQNQPRPVQAGPGGRAEPLESSPQNIIEQVPKLNSPAQLTQPVYIVENIVKPLKK